MGEKPTAIVPGNFPSGAGTLSPSWNGSATTSNPSFVRKAPRSLTKRPGAFKRPSNLQKGDGIATIILVQTDETYEVIDNPDGVIEIAEWESPEVRQTWLKQSMDSGPLSQLMEVLDAPFKAINIRQMP
jgi:hypothetical protein